MFTIDGNIDEMAAAVRGFPRGGAPFVPPTKQDRVFWNTAYQSAQDAAAAEAAATATAAAVVAGAAANGDGGESKDQGAGAGGGREDDG
jgi:hypothetical protein